MGGAWPHLVKKVKKMSRVNPKISGASVSAAKAAAQKKTTAAKKKSNKKQNDEQ